MDLPKKIKDLNAFMESDEGKELAAKFVLKYKLIEENNSKWENHIIKKLSNANDAELEIILNHFFKWEEKMEDLYYARCIQTSSNLFDRLYDAWVKLGEPFESDEDFFSGGSIYRGYVFKIFCGQGCFYRVEKNGEIIFQTT
jgi:hypothetical protein